MGSGAAQSDTSISLLMEENTEPDRSWKFNLGCQSRRRCVSQRSERAVEVQQLLKDAEALIRQTQESVRRDIQVVPPEAAQNVLRQVEGIICMNPALECLNYPKWFRQHSNQVKLLSFTWFTAGKSNLRRIKLESSLSNNVLTKRNNTLLFCQSIKMVLFNHLTNYIIRILFFLLFSFWCFICVLWAEWKYFKDAGLRVTCAVIIQSDSLRMQIINCTNTDILITAVVTHVHECSQYLTGCVQLLYGKIWSWCVSL